MLSEKADYLSRCGPRSRRINGEGERFIRCWADDDFSRSGLLCFDIYIREGGSEGRTNFGNPKPAKFTSEPSKAQPRII